MLPYPVSYPSPIPVVWNPKPLIRMLNKIATLLEMIKFEHTVFALPFAFMGAFLAAGGTPDVRVFILVVIAMVGARTSAMGFNRIVDAGFDRANPRTAQRAIPAGKVSMSEAWILVLIAAAVFFIVAYFLNPLVFMISPLALGLTFVYSLTKRFTWLCHVVLGLALAFSPFGGWIAVTGSIRDYPWYLSFGVMLWVGGFDAVYACLDADYDRSVGLFSLPARFGRKNAFRLAGVFHFFAFVLFVLTGYHCGLNYIYYVGLALAGIALISQHRVVSPGDLSRIQMSFFTMNGVISLVLFTATWLSL